ncbi:tetratricopeptide repeat protein [Aulosira sp. FACHB-615]|uniref:tetratricopeptide repeat protein n=1 Tax=Aulosira sp. FACHB-615 TaxID=2692777 RepID=UPI0016828139|nr:tetratricopeptide repeat protein [Aulosira sp. FACHB-615]MBD2489583.1 tetratricopeptide repeat protein [Aulosira sp. FACHB-615]
MAGFSDFEANSKNAILMLYPHLKPKEEIFMNTIKNSVKSIITEEHSSQLHVWHQLGWKNVTLIYLDEHLDFQYISENHITALKKCQTSAELAQLERPSHIFPDDKYSYGIENFLFAAHRLGIIENLIWVTLTPKNKLPNSIKYMRKLRGFLQQHNAFTVNDITNIAITEDIATATVFGLKITVCGYEDLKKLKLPENTFIDIDIDYFIGLPEQYPLVDPENVFACLKSLPINYDTVTLTRSVSSGYMPLRYYFLADYLAALWQNDLREIEHYRRLYALDQQARNNNIEAAKAGCLEEIQIMPNCAATYYLLSLCETETQKSVNYELIAGKLCPSYCPSVLHLANAILSRDLEYDKNTLSFLENKLMLAEIDIEEKILSHYTLGILYSLKSEKEESLKHYRYCQEIKPGNYPDLSLNIGCIFMKNKDYTKAISFFEQALADESSKAEAHKMLGKIYLEQGQYQIAEENLILAGEIVPTDELAMKLLAKLYKEIGDETSYKHQISKYYHMKFLSQKFT